MTFGLKEVFDLKLIGFGQQNVIGSLLVERVEGGYRLVLEVCFGISGTLDARDIFIQIMPAIPL